MTMTRARLWTMGVALVAVVAASAPAMAGQRGEGRRFDGPRGHRGPHGGFRQVLTQEQREQIRPWLKEEREASKPLMDLRKQLRDAVLADAPDQGKIASLQAQIGTAQGEALTRRTALTQRVVALLTVEQRKQLRDGRMLPPFLDPTGAPGRPPRGPGRFGGPAGPGGPGGPGGPFGLDDDGPDGPEPGDEM